jgi:hypothetical protein
MSRSIMSNSPLSQALIGSKGDSNISKLMFGSDATTCGHNEAYMLKSSIDSIVKHSAVTNAFPEVEREVALDSTFLMEPVQCMESVQLGLESTMLAKGLREDRESTDCVKRRAFTTVMDGAQSPKRAALGTKRGDGSDDQDEQDFLAFIEQVLGPLPGDGSAIFAFQ